METGRGRKGKKAGWHVTLGIKDAIFAGVGVVGLMMMGFALGTLAGRGEIYRVAYSLGLLSPEGLKVAPMSPVSGPDGATVVSSAAPGATTATAPAPPAATPGAAPGTAAAKAAAPAPVTGSIAGAIATATPQKKTKGGSSLHRDQKAKEEELRKVRQEVAGKLKFQNSFDTGPKVSQKQKPKEKEKQKAPTLVRVGQFRDSTAAKAKVAELQKKGIKATLKQGKDSKGPLYTVYKPGAAGSPGPEKVAQGSPGAEKTGETKQRPPNE